MDQFYPEVKLPWIRYVHQLSGAILAFFLFIHLSNHLFAFHSAAMHQQVMQLFRKVYRFPPVEGVIFLAVGTQIVTGLRLVVYQWKQSGLMKRLQLISGLYLAFFLVIHVWAVLVARYSWQVETDIHFATAGLKNSDSRLFFLPYYSLSVAAVFVHIASIHYNKSVQAIIFKNGEGVCIRKIRQQTVSILVVGLLLMVLIMTAICTTN